MTGTVAAAVAALMMLRASTKWCGGVGEDSVAGGAVGDGLLCKFACPETETVYVDRICKEHFECCSLLVLLLSEFMLLFLSTLCLGMHLQLTKGNPL